MNKAVFLDRDGVINPNVFNPSTGEWESPHTVEDFILFPWTIEALRRLREHNYLLFLVSNQPSYAKGKCSLEDIKAIHGKLVLILDSNKIDFSEFFYCYHHPMGIVPKYSGPCVCRKPNTFFLEKAKREYQLNMSLSWMVGDRDTDILCGQTVGVKTILVRDKDVKNSSNKYFPDFAAADLSEAVRIIIENS